LDFLEDKQTKTAPQKTKENFQPGKKRQQKNSKFGFGGQKKRTKFNTKESVDDFTSVPRFKANKGGSKNVKQAGGKGGKKQHGGKKQRPGKSKRQNAKNKQRSR